MRKAPIYYARMNEFWRQEEKLNYLEKIGHIGNINWQEIKHDKNYNWLTEGLENEFEMFVYLGNKETKATKVDVNNCVFKLFSNGVKTNRDVWAYNFSYDDLSANIERMITHYNDQAIKWNQKKDCSIKVDDFVNSDDEHISWSGSLKDYLKRGITIEYSSPNIR